MEQDMERVREGGRGRVERGDVLTLCLHIKYIHLM